MITTSRADENRLINAEGPINILKNQQAKLKQGLKLIDDRIHALNGGLSEASKRRHQIITDLDLTQRIIDEHDAPHNPSCIIADKNHTEGCVEVPRAMKVQGAINRTHLPEYLP